MTSDVHHDTIADNLARERCACATSDKSNAVPAGKGEELSQISFGLR
jgi:hypothetical protein